MFKKLSGTLYALELGDGYASDVEALAGLPGLRQNNNAHRVEGSIDAVCAAAFRLKRDLPTLPQPAPVHGHHLELRPYQNEGVVFLLDRLRQFGGAILADDMGLGKTLQAITTAKELTRGGGRVLVCAPAFLRMTWVEELAKWGETSVAALKPKKTKADAAEWEKAASAKWVITSYNFADKALKAGFAKQTPRMLIMDEAHLLAGRDTKRAKALETLAVLCPYRLAISGTPMWSRPRDFYQLVKLLFGRRFGDRYSFDVAYAGGFINEFGGMDNRQATNTDELRLRLSIYQLRRLKSEVAKDLPSLTRQIIWLDPVPEATAAFHSALQAQTIGATVHALEATLAAKMDAVCNAAAQAKQFLLFTYRKDHAAQMAETLACDYDTPCELVTGDMASDKRVGAIHSAAARGAGVVATIDSMGAGVNAQSLGSFGIFHCLDYVPAKLAQAEARLHRIGQTQPVTWQYYAVRESMDELVIKTIVDKLDAERALLGSGKEMRDQMDESYSGGLTEEEAARALYEAI